MRAALIIIEPPGFDDVLGLDHRGEWMYGQPFIAQSTMKRFKDGVFYRFAGPNKVERHAPTIGPLFERS
jgi:hypothetical protein